MMAKRRSLTVNLAAIAGMSLFWIGGMQGLPAGQGWPQWAGLAIQLVLLCAAAFFAARERFALTLPIGHLDRTDVLFIAIFAVAMLVFSWSRLTQELWSDAVYHASLASRHAQLVLFYARDHLPLIWRTIDAVDSRLIIWAFNATGLAIVALVFIGAPAAFRRAPIVTAVLWAGFFLVTRFGFSPEHGIFEGLSTPVLFGSHPEQDPHPPLRLLPLWVSSGLLGPNEFGFRMAGFATYLALMSTLYVGLRLRLSQWTAGLAVLAIATIPVLWQTAYLVEPSIWVALAGMALFALFASPEYARVSLVVPAMAALLATYMRAPGFILLVALLGLAIARMARARISQRELAIVAILVGCALWGSLSGTLGGSPALAETSPITQLFSAVTNNVPYVALVAAAGLVPFFFVGYALRTDTETGLILAVTVVAFLLIATAVFYGPTRVVLWGTPRYQAEIAVPVITAGIVAFAYAAATPASFKVRGRSFHVVSLMCSLAPATPLLVVIALNIFGMTTLDRNTYKYFQHPIPGHNANAEGRYPLKSAFKRARARGVANNVYYVGIWYGGFQSVLQGYSVADYAAFSLVNERHRAGWAVNVEAVKNDQTIKAVMVENDASFGVIEPLEAAGWSRETFTHPRSGLQMILLFRP